MQTAIEKRHTQDIIRVLQRNAAYKRAARRAVLYGDPLPMTTLLLKQKAEQHVVR